MKFVSSSHFIKYLTYNWNIHFISVIVQNLLKRFISNQIKYFFMVINTTWGHTMELGSLLYKIFYKFAKTFYNVRSIHIFAIVFVRNNFSTHYRVIFNYWYSHMNFLYAIFNFMKYGFRSLVARTQSLKSSVSCFICLKLVGYSQHHLKSMFLNIFCPFVWEKSTLLSFVFFYVFRIFLEIMKNGLRYLVALTPSIVFQHPLVLIVRYYYHLFHYRSKGSK